jgi:hypothetical protein
VKYRCAFLTRSAVELLFASSFPRVLQCEWQSQAAVQTCLLVPLATRSP